MLCVRMRTGRVLLVVMRLALFVAGVVGGCPHPRIACSIPTCDSFIASAFWSKELLEPMMEVRFW